RNRRRSTDDRHAAAVAVDERRAGFLLRDSFLDDSRDIRALLHRHRRHPGQRFTVLMRKVGQIADDKYFRMAGNAKIGLDYDSPAPIDLRAGGLRKQLSER